MKKKIGLILLVSLCIGLLTGCAGKYDAEESTVFVLKDGKIVSTDVEEFSDDYDQSALADYVDQQISDFNSENGDKAVKKTSLKVKDGTAKLILQYDSATSYTDFNGVELFVGTVAEAKEAGYDFDTEFASVEKGKVGNLAEASDFSDDAKVVIYKGNGNLQVKGNILYASTTNTKLLSKNAVSIAEGNYLLGESVGSTEKLNVTEETESTEIVTEEITEDLPSDAEEDVDSMVFDFPEEEEEETSEFSSVYTYLIYE